MYYHNKFAVIIPMANEEDDFDVFKNALTLSLDKLKSGTVYFIVDKVSKDRTLELCNELAAQDKRFITLWAPENKNVVDAYLHGYIEAYKANHDLIIEMDAGMSHDPAALPMFLRVLNEGNECAFGSRFINGGSIFQSNIRRTFLSKAGTILANILLGTQMHDMTSGYQGFQRHIVKSLLDYKLLSKAHFYQTEVRYLLRQKKYMEVPIHYRAPSPRVSQRAITNSLRVLWHYFTMRLKGNAISIPNETPIDSTDSVNSLN